MSKKILIAFFVLLILAIVGLYVFDLVVNKSSPTENLFRTIAVLFVCLAGIIRASRRRGRRSLSYYEAEYVKEIEHAFENSFFDRKKLLCAIRLYNEDDYRKSVKYLNSLKPKCETREDVSAVGLFLALNFTDAELYEQAVRIYNEIIELGVTSSRIYSNLSYVCSKMGNYDDAITYIHLAIGEDSGSATAYNNLAALYFDTADFDNAIIYAKKALEINHKMRSSATYLAIIYSLRNDKANAEKYSHVALSAGAKPESLKETIEHYRSAQVIVPDKKAEVISESETETDENEE